MTIEAKLDELIGAVRALNDTMYEVKQAVAGGVASAPPVEKETPDAEPAAPATPAPTDQPTKQDVVAALKALEEAKGRDAVVGLLKSHGARNLTTLEEEKYSAVIEEAAA